MSTKKKLLQAAAGVSTGPEGAWDLSYAYYDPSADLAWDISTTVYIRLIDISPLTSAESAFFKPDGTKMFIVCKANDAVFQYTLSTAWDISTASLVAPGFSVQPQDTNPSGLFFKPDGTKMYVSGASGDSIEEYDLSTAWDVTTASHNQTASIASQDANPRGIFFKSDGTKMYMNGATGIDVTEFDLSTAWDISTLSASQTFSVSSQETDPTGLFFKSDGTKMYVVGNTGNDINEYDLSTAWDISTASYNQNFSVSGQATNPRGIYIKDDGTALYLIGQANNRLIQYNLGGFYVGAYESQPYGVDFKPEGDKMYIVGPGGDEINEFNVLGGFNVSAQTGTDSTGFFFKDDGSKMYVLGQTGPTVADGVHEYDLSTSWDISTASFLQSFSVATQENAPTAVFFKSDGTKMYVIGTTGDDVNEYNLSTAWDVSTSTYSQNFSFAAQEANPRGIFFKDDGTKMYISGVGSNSVNEYNLSTAWDVTTASYSQNFSISSQDLNSRGLFFKPDGTKMYISGATGDNIYEYNLSTAWDVSSATYNQNFDISNEEATPQGVFFKPDGTRMFMTGQATDSVYAYDLGTAWDVSTAEVVIPESYLFNLSKFSYKRTFSVSAQDTAPYAVRFKPDGTKMYVLGTVGLDINEYNLSTAWDVSSAVYSQAFSYDAGDQPAYGMFFKPDGTKVYVTGLGQRVGEYNLSTAWDISTASFSQSFSTASYETQPFDVFFDPDGTKMFIIGWQGDDVTEYELSTEWDVSTASYVQEFDLTQQMTFVGGLYFKDDGTKMFISSLTGDMVQAYTLGPQ